MNLQLQKIKVQKTARYYTYGSMDAKNYCILLHGYAMPAKEMITVIEGTNSDWFFIAPEGLSRFYRKGVQGDVVASWMTKEDREDEIIDYIAYLNVLMNQFDIQHKNMYVLGFSQGVATMSRWLEQSAYSFKHIVMWAGEPPADINYKTLCNKAEKSSFIYGTNDPYITHENAEKIKQRLIDTPFEFITFEGAHVLDKKTLNELLIM